MSRLHTTILLSFAALAAWPAQAQTGAAVPGNVTLVTPDTGNFQLSVVSYSEVPFRTVLHQQYDYSCGSAALATMLRFNYSINSNEAEVFKAMYAVGDQASIRKLGFSLLDMKNYLASRGFQADGYRLTLDQLDHLNTPAIVLIQVGSYKHFVVVKGALDNNILVGDPAKGLQLYAGLDFQKIWNGIAFVIHGADTPLVPIFNSKSEWSHWTDSHPLAAVVLSPQLTQLTRDLWVIYQIRPFEVIPNSLSQ